MAQRRKRVLIVDGYNVLRSGYRYRNITSPDYTHDAYNRARELLINDVVLFAGKEYAATIVFDGYGNQFSTGEPTKVGGVKIIFSPEGNSADKVIEKLAHEAREKGCEVLVVTSDASIQDAVFGGLVDRMSAAGFCHEMELYHQDVHQEENPKVSSKNTVEGRIDKSTLAKLKALRDSM